MKKYLLPHIIAVFFTVILVSSSASTASINTKISTPKTPVHSLHPLTVTKKTPIINQDSTPHEPISINKTTNMTQLGFTGNGTRTNPYLIQNLYFTGNRTQTFLTIEGTSTYITIQNNTFNAGKVAITIKNATHITITNNTFTKNMNACNIIKASQITIENNTSIGKNQSFDKAYILTQTNHTLITHNTISLNLDGIEIKNSQNNTITKNTFSHVLSMVSLENTKYTLIHDNYGPNHTGGVNAENTKHVTITNNVMNGGYSGSSLTSARNVTIMNNTITNTQIAIYLLRATNVSITNNTIETSTTGFLLYYLNHTLITHNTLKYNPEHIFMYNAENTLIIENYWTGWSCPDYNHDGIVDYPYSFDFGNDTRPLALNEPDNTPPQVIPPEPLTYLQNTTGNTLTWQVTDQHPERYNITQDNTPIIINTPWINGSITITVDNLPPGTHTYTLTIIDGKCNKAISSVTVTVTVTSPTTTTNTLPSPQNNSNTPFPLITSFMTLFILTPITTKKHTATH